ncbi:hypothetical protein ABZ646_07230 [Streptomyces sp. NPDC007162]|uniref:hypothetical protein n=1 Tax=Streptomyces sp. NPDC007162 TaxID=3156917 RepID=UPI0033D7522F
MTVVQPTSPENVSAQVPAPGQRVTVRNRPWVVTDVLRSTAASDDPARAAEATPSHLITLTSLGWTPLDLNRNFHETPNGPRWSVDPNIQMEMNDRLLELNHVMYADEVQRGLHSKSTIKNKRSTRGDDASRATLF